MELDSPTPEDTITDLDTIHMMGRIVRDQKREELKPKPADPAVKLDPGAGAQPVEHTVTLPRMAPNAVPSPVTPRKPEVAPRRISATGAVLVVVLALAVLLWMIWGRK